MVINLRYNIGDLKNVIFLPIFPKFDWFLSLIILKELTIEMYKKKIY